jgi:hypothetical protein
MQCGFNHALYALDEFFTHFEPGIKEHRLSTYKGMKLIIKKLIEYRREFFVKGKEVDIIFTKKELEDIRSVKKRSSN